MSGRYKAYPEYKDSGVELLGDIPSHWTVDKFRYLFSLGRGLGITKANLQDSGIPCVNYGEIHSKYGFEVSPDTHPLRCVSELYLESSPNSLLSNGDCVFADTSEDIEGAGNFTQLTSDQALFAGYHTVIARPKGENDARFLAYVFDSPAYRTQIRLAVKGVKVFSITQEILKNTDLWLAPLPEQKQIARFLDDETGKIDALIEKQQALIALLQEKRQAVISHAVTKGLNPEAPMKDSGVEWLGDVPEHWEVASLKFYAQVIDCKHITAEFIDAGYPLASIGEVKGWHINLEGAKLTSQKFYSALIEGDREPRSGDIIYSRNATVGEAALVPDEHPEFAMGQDVCLIRLGDALYPEFALHVLKSGLISQQLDVSMIGSTFKRINVDDIRCFTFTLPPLDEQRDLVAELNEITVRYDSLIDNALQASDLLQERRTALISAAVTGNIDVRDFAPEALEKGEE
ncbi:restriction endonuclease subunit S [Coraliomargarita sp. SDUM461004]|uniref:Restriction endonuclease subunit S n=1 Tax=Thalassobacterium sedimentorum TaxID=3041258 RepID=A0ABU1AGU2_9BACT|nr:restriction endonuclease subunit S [Coraliomargarita sp. SDUM461004]MDQ8194042.1 restriction endonuclease subunit S [Coraliomargarita sp. SDUM461004]